MRRGAWFVATVAAGCALAVAGCGDDESGSSSSSGSSGGGEKPGKVAVLLPDSKSSVRWETVDRPFLKQAFDAAGVESEIQNAEGDKSTQQQQAEQAITNGAKVLLLVNLDSGSGAAIAANAKSQDVKVIDYDRLTLVGDQSVPDWDNQKALTIFEQMLQKANNKVDGVLAANDGLGNAAISALKQRKLPQIPVTGQDATLQGIQNVVNGDQCMTVYKPGKAEVDAA